MLSVGTVVIGVEDLHRAVGFWMRALDYVPKREIGAGDDFAILVPAVGHGAHLALGVNFQIAGLSYGRHAASVACFVEIGNSSRCCG